MKKLLIKFWKYSILRTIFSVMLVSTSARAGPPFRTDDPQPVDFLHWEFYIASEQQFTRHETNATCPHVEINYGAFPNVQLHVVAPLGYIRTLGGTHFGYSDTEVGVKCRFVEETESVPQIGFFPLIEIPTGDQNKQLGNGNIQAFVPVWIQKSWGKLTTYGGGGVWYTPEPDRTNWGFAGWEIQYDFSERITLGGEVNYQTAETQDSESSAGCNLGGFVHLNEHHHILFSFGRSMSGETAWSGYIGYQLTI